MPRDTLSSTNDTINKWLRAVDISRQSAVHFFDDDDPIYAMADPGSPLKRKRVSSPPGYTYPSGDFDLPSRAPRTSLPSQDKITKTAITGSSAPSPIKQMRKFDLLDEGIEWCQPGPDMPATAFSFIGQMRLVGRGIGFLPRSHISTLKPHLTDEYTGMESDSAFAAPGRPDEEVSRLPGHIPPPWYIRGIVQMARKLNNLHHEEASWNSEVHSRLLRSVLRPLLADTDQQPEAVFVDFVSATCALPAVDFRPRHVPVKKVEFVIYIEPENDPKTALDGAAAVVDDQAQREARARARVAVRNSIEALQRSSGTESVNPTEYFPLRKTPMALCIETKRQDAGLAEANLQIGVWHACHWKFLRKHASPDALYRLAFLPGIIIEGHNWFVVVSTPKEVDHVEDMISRVGSETGKSGRRRLTNKTVVWSRIPIGSTSSLSEAYQIIGALRLLAGWVQMTYWPWFKEFVLNIS